MKTYKFHSILSLLTILTFFTLSCKDIFEEDISDDSITLYAPGDSVSLTDSEVSFSWESMADDSSITYQLQIITPNFEEAEKLIEDTTIYENSYTIDLDDGNYTWRVRAINSAYKSDFFTRYFTVNTESEDSDSTSE